MRVGIVAIGRNEGERLRACLASASASGAPVVYVDSGSSDGSAALARGFGAVVVELDLSRPFTAARARNAGAARLVALYPDAELIQFIDGDCEFAPDWIARGKAELGARPKAAVVCGRTRERHPEASRYNALCDLEWDTPVGRTDSCGGIAMIRRAAFEAVGGFDSELVAGEEPDLCLRLRRQGWEVWRIDAEMVLHDAAMTRFGQWWRRNLRAGFAYASVAHRHRRGGEGFWRREVRSNYLWALPVMWPLWPLLWVRIRRARGSPLYASFTTLSKLPQAFGQLRFHRGLFRGRRAELIEYK